MTTFKKSSLSTGDCAALRKQGSDHAVSGMLTSMLRLMRTILKGTIGKPYARYCSRWTRSFSLHTTQSKNKSKQAKAGNSV